MPSYSIKFNVAGIIEKTVRATNKAGFPIAQQKANLDYLNARTKFLEEFEDSKVTQEIEAGESSLDFSGATQDYGNLYSFLGFENGRKPISELRDILNTISIRYTIFRYNTWYFRVNTPSKEIIEETTHSDWGDGESWISHVEGGLSNLANYLYVKDRGRSLHAVQAPHEINDDLVFEPQQYLTKMFKNFRENIYRSQ